MNPTQCRSYPFPKPSGSWALVVLFGLVARTLSWPHGALRCINIRKTRSNSPKELCTVLYFALGVLCFSPLKVKTGYELTTILGRTASGGFYVMLDGR
jgi:hypothetical protein